MTESFAPCHWYISSDKGRPILKPSAVRIAVILLIFLEYAHPTRATTPRTATIELRDPRNSFKANTAVWQASAQLIALGAERLEAQTIVKHSILVRSGLFVSGLWLNATLRFYSHEIAHEYLYRSKNIDVANALDFQHWKSSYIPGLYYPGWKQHALDAAKLSESELLYATTAGLTQDELNAESLWRSNSKRGALSAFDAQAFLLTKLRAVAYIAGSGSEKRPFAAGLEIHQLQRAVHEQTPRLYDDVNFYRLMLLNKGVGVTNRQLLRRALLTDLLSMRTWESLVSIIAFIIHGDMSTDLYTIAPGKNRAIMPPLFSNYLAGSGSFINSSTMIGINGRQMRIEIGSMLGYSKTRTFQGFRFGVAAPYMPLTKFWQVQPFAAINTADDWRVNGYAIGLENSFYFIKNMAFVLRVDRSSNDILKNIVKQEHNGFHAILGLRQSF